MKETADRLADAALDDGGKVLDYPPHDEDDLYDLYDVVICHEHPTARDALVLAGLLNPEGVVVAPSEGMLGRRFQSVVQDGDAVVASDPKNPEKCRVDAERFRQRSE